MNLLKKYFRTSVIAVILTSIFAPISIASAGQNSIDILSVSEGLDNSVDINFISDFPENKVSSYEIIATADYSKLSKSTSISQATFSQEITSTKKVVTKKLVVPALTKMQPPKVSSSELKQIQKLGKKLALKIAASNKGSVNKGAVASFAEGVCILYGDCRNQGVQSKVSNNQIYTYIFKPIISGISYVFEVASKNVFGTKITSAPFEYPPFSSLIDLISNLPADWGNPKPTPTTTPTPAAATAAPIVISVAAIAGVTAPVTGATPVTTTTAGTGYTGTVSWSGSPVTFAVATTYTATITLTATSAYTLTGVTANFFTVAGATSVTHSANSGVITAVFPSTEAAAASAAAIAGVTAPVTGATPVTTTTAGTGYTGTVSWSGSPSTFAAVTTYTATITLTPTSGYTLTGVTANFFTVAGATSVTHSANSGVITAVFPSTEAAATKVAITRASVGTQRRTAFTTQPQIAIQNASSNTVTSSSAVITATVSAGGTLVGTTTATASSGVATFTNLGVDGTIGTTYTITYTAPGLTVTTATVTLTRTTCDGTTFTCQVGDTGPGGGMVFYVTSGGGTFACGPTRSATCKYLEAAPTTGTANWTDAQYQWSGNTNTLIGASAQGTEIGTGYANTLAIVGQSGGGNTPFRAATSARAHRGPNGLSDWFLPSKDELNQMCKWARGITGINLTTETTVCSGGSINTGSGAEGFVGTVHGYYSSTEISADFAWRQYFTTGVQANGSKGATSYVRPVRAF